LFGSPTMNPFASSNTSTAVAEALMPILCSMDGQLTPLRAPTPPSASGKNLGTMNKLMPLVPAGASRRLGPDFPGDVLSFEAKVVKRYHEAGEVRVELKNSKKRTTVEEIAPGALRMQLPIAIPGLRHVNMYCFSGCRRRDRGRPRVA
jgi:hypothetical protein